MGEAIHNLKGSGNKYQGVLGCVSTHPFPYRLCETLVGLESFANREEFTVLGKEAGGRLEENLTTIFCKPVQFGPSMGGDNRSLDDLDSVAAQSSDESILLRETITLEASSRWPLWLGGREICVRLGA